MAAFHLEQLVEAGLVDVAKAARAVPASPAGGRPAKRYVPSRLQIELTLPPRRYDVAAAVLVNGLKRLGLESGPGRTILAEAKQAGHELGSGRSLLGILRELGYEPVRSDGEIVLRNCPFHDLTQQARREVCNLNLSLLEGLVEGLPCDMEARLTAFPGECCVRIR